MNEIETYSITVEVKDSNGNVFINEKGNKVHDFQFELSFSKDNAERFIRDLANRLKVFMPTNQIDISARWFSNISETYMLMYSFYGDEDRFIKH